MIQLRLLGASEIRIGRKVIAPSAEVVFAFGVYLCVRAGDRIPREDVSETFWGGADGQGRHSLRQMLYRLRQKGFVLDEEGEELYLDPARVDSDLATALAEGWPDTAAARDVEAAGQFAPGFTRVISAKFSEWLDGVRDRLSSQHRRACLNQIAQARREGRWADLDRWALQILRFDPLNEEATLARAESAAVSGSKAVALEILDAYVEELGDRATVIGLPASVLRKRIAERGPEWIPRGPREVPLVGREELMARLTGYVEAAARGEGNAVLLWGAPGIGKTRLADEVCSYARLKGFHVVHIRAAASDARPLGLAASLIPRLLELPGALGCHPTSITTLRRAVASAPATTDSSLTTLVSIHAALKAAFVDMLEAISEEGRLLIFTDDLHNADRSSHEMLRAAALGQLRRKVLWIATTRQRPVRGGEDGHEHAAILVPPLAPASSVHLATRLAAGTRVAAPDRLYALSQASGGNPLFVRELVLNAGNGEAAGLPRSLSDYMSERLARMDEQLLSLLRWVCTLGPHATIPRLRSLAKDQRHLSETIEEAESQALLKVGSGRALELHECWQQAVRKELGPATQASIAHECAELLESEEGTELSVAWHTAVLYEEAGARSRALALYCEIVERMLATGLPRDGNAIIERALALADTDEARVRVLLLRARAESASTEYDRVVSTTAEALALVRIATPEHRRQHAALLLLNTVALAKLQLNVPTQLELVAALAADTKLDAHSRHHACFRGLTFATENGALGLVEHFVRHAREISASGTVTADGLLVELIYCAENGDVDGVMRADRELELLDCEIDAGDSRSRALRLRALAMRFIGETSRAKSLGQRAFEIATQCLAVEQQIAVAENMVHAALDEEDLDSAAEWLERLGAGARNADQIIQHQALAHAQIRFHCQAGRALDAFSILEASALYRRMDTVPRRKCVDLALSAFCAANVGRFEWSDEALSSLDVAIAGQRPSLIIDFAMELRLRALLLHGRTSAAESIGADYACQRKRTIRTRPARFYRTLQNFLVSDLSS